VLVAVFISLNSGSVLADDWDDQTKWEELDNKPLEPVEPDRIYWLSAQTIPVELYGTRASIGYPMLSLGFQTGLAKQFDIMVDFSMPLSMPGQAFLIGTGAKYYFYNKNKFHYAAKLTAYTVLLTDSKDEINKMAPGIFLMPSFLMGIHLTEGCFYAEVGVMLYPYIFESSPRDYVLYGIPMKYGGEIYITEDLHIFTNVNLAVTLYSVGFVFAGIEAGVSYAF
jgi:hypothetical protein